MNEKRKQLLADIAADYVAGKSSDEIKQSRGVGSSTVCAALDLHNVERRTKGRWGIQAAPERLAAIAADYAAGMGIETIRVRHSCGKSTIRYALAACGVERRRGSPIAGSAGPEVLHRVVDLIREGRGNRAICQALKIGYKTIRKACAVHGVQMPNHWQQVRDPHDAKLAALPADHWEQLRKRGASVCRVAVEMGIPERALSRWCRAKGLQFWPRSGGPKPKANKPPRSPRRIPAASMLPTPPRVWPTRQDYADQCDREFATPHYLRRAPEMLRLIEAREAREIAEQREREARRSARRASACAS